jgi:hypothetical protein
MNIDDEMTDDYKRRLRQTSRIAGSGEFDCHPEQVEAFAWRSMPRAEIPSESEGPDVARDLGEPRHKSRFLRR